MPDGVVRLEAVLHEADSQPDSLFKLCICSFSFPLFNHIGRARCKYGCCSGFLII